MIYQLVVYILLRTSNIVEIEFTSQSKLNLHCKPVKTGQPFRSSLGLPSNTHPRSFMRNRTEDLWSRVQTLNL